MIPAALRTSRQTVTGLVKQKQSSARFRLDALVDVLCKPLQQLLGEKRYFLSQEQCSSLDCLALGYLALALKPDVPQKWLQERMKDRYRGLCAFVGRGVEECFGERVRVEDALQQGIAIPTAVREGTNQTALPWGAPAQKGINSAGTTIVNAALDLLPFSQSTILSSPTDSASESTNKSGFSPVLPLLVTVSTAIAATAGYLLYYASYNSSEPEQRRLENMGEAGAMLAGLDFTGIEESGGQEEPREILFGNK